ncbi:glycoside hydrolase family 76 protein [Catenuloplanes atrovinosus]|uniref:Alpha-1,6-mannanase (GH76 family) n=1 Tax=Catenuloplanes atrovinosus TaxID=137266 RepID=A0AAE3YQ27_9ACTN|nr:glycoside hydrolase family 76 protein [Catenuloplanes atrovinosus]MDR7276496.1 putative alpha-1,6-mannanase (GH76 family) [Catenuloplanes atrovinosus]
MKRKIVGAVVLAVTAAGGFVAQTSAGSAAELETAAVICNLHCDGRDPAQAGGDRAPVSAAVHGRTLRAHVSDPDTMIWATIENGAAGDETWLDRSFDGGRTWTPAGRTAVPAGSRAWRTGMFNVDDWNARGVGVLRACGKAGDRPEVACTPWVRSTWNAGDRKRAAATALMMRYDQSTGLFDGNAWWTSANAMSALIENARVSGMGSYRYAIANTYDRQINGAWGQFRNEYIDDTGWWGLAWVAAYDLTGDVRYLNTARADADHMHAYWDGVCGGGVWWRSDKQYKNAIANSLYIQLNAVLAQRTGDAAYRARAEAGWAWFRNTGMINGDNLVIDGISLQTCRGVSGPLTYNQGVLIHALTELNRLTGSADALGTARRLADAVTVSGRLTQNGILREPGEQDSCTGDQPAWKGAFARGLGTLDRATGGAYTPWLRRNADTMHAANRNSFDAYGSHWSGPYVDTNHSCQQSALDLLNTV